MRNDDNNVADRYAADTDALPADPRETAAAAEGLSRQPESEADTEAVPDTVESIDPKLNAGGASAQPSLSRGEYENGAPLADFQESDKYRPDAQLMSENGAEADEGQTRGFDGMRGRAEGYDRADDYNRPNTPPQDYARADYYTRPSTPPQGYEYADDYNRPSTPPQDYARADYYTRPSTPPQGYEYADDYNRPSAPPQDYARADYYTRPNTPPQGYEYANQNLQSGSRRTEYSHYSNAADTAGTVTPDYEFDAQDNAILSRIKHWLHIDAPTENDDYNAASMSPGRYRDSLQYSDIDDDIYLPGETRRRSTRFSPRRDIPSNNYEQYRRQYEAELPSNAAPGIDYSLVDHPVSGHARKSRYRLTSALVVFSLVLVVGLLGIVSLLHGVPQTGENEPPLRTVPQFNSASLLNGSYLNSVESYYADAFPLRRTFKTVASGVRSLAGVNVNAAAGGNRPGEPGLPVAATAEPNETESPASAASPDASPAQPSATAQTTPVPTVQITYAPMLTAVPPATNTAYDVVNNCIVSGNRAMEIYNYNEQTLLNYAQTLNQLAQSLPGKRVYSLLALGASELYGPLSYTGEQYSQLRAVQTVRNALQGVEFVDGYSALTPHQAEEIFFRTDNHWTALGAYYAYTAFARSAGLEPVSLSEYQVSTLEGFVGNLYAATNLPVLNDNPDTITYYQPLVNYAARSSTGSNMSGAYDIVMAADKLGRESASDDKYRVFMCGDHAVVRVESSADVQRKILVVKDSFANPFIPFLLPHYKEIYAIDMSMFNESGTTLQSFVERYAIDEVLFLNSTANATSELYRTSLQKLQ